MRTTAPSSTTSTVPTVTQRATVPNGGLREGGEAAALADTVLLEAMRAPFCHDALVLATCRYAL